MAFTEERIPSTLDWVLSPKGRHIELGIAEMNPVVLITA
jgi:pyruvate dehydrogenase E1 component